MEVMKRARQYNTDENYGKVQLDEIHCDFV